MIFKIVTHFSHGIVLDGGTVYVLSVVFIFQLQYFIFSGNGVFTVKVYCQITCNDVYYNDTNGVFIIFDLTNRKTFDNVSGWIEDLREYADSNCEIIIVGNKSDLVEQIVVSPDEIKKFSNTYKLNYIEVSAKHGTNIVLLFETLINQMVAKQKVKDSVREGADRMYVNRQNLYQEDHKEKVGCC